MLLTSRFTKQVCHFQVLTLGVKANNDPHFSVWSGTHCDILRRLKWTSCHWTVWLLLFLWDSINTWEVTSIHRFIKRVKWFKRWENKDFLFFLFFLFLFLFFFTFFFLRILIFIPTMKTLSCLVTLIPTENAYKWSRFSLG